MELHIETAIYIFSVYKIVGHGGVKSSYDMDSYSVKRTKACIPTYFHKNSLS